MLYKTYPSENFMNNSLTELKGPKDKKILTYMTVLNKFLVRELFLYEMEHLYVSRFSELCLKSVSQTLCV